MKKKILIVLFVIFAFFVCAEVLNAFSFDYVNILDAPKAPDFNISTETTTCAQILGPNLVKVVKAAIKVLQIAAALIAIVKGMLELIPPIIAKDQDALNKVSRRLVTMGIILVIIFMIPALCRILGNILGFDISCIF